MPNTKDNNNNQPKMAHRRFPLIIEEGRLLGRNGLKGLINMDTISIKFAAGRPDFIGTKLVDDKDLDVLGWFRHEAKDHFDTVDEVNGYINTLAQEGDFGFLDEVKDDYSNVLDGVYEPKMKPILDYKWLLKGSEDTFAFYALSVEAIPCWKYMNGSFTKFVYYKTTNYKDKYIKAVNKKLYMEHFGQSMATEADDFAGLEEA